MATRFVRGPSTATATATATSLARAITASVSVSTSSCARGVGRGTTVPGSTTIGSGTARASGAGRRGRVVRGATTTTTTTTTTREERRGRGWGETNARGGKRGRRAGGMRLFASGGRDARRGDARVAGEVRCTEKEREVFDTLLEVVEHFKLDVTLRVAGGWVRDKLIGERATTSTSRWIPCWGKISTEKVNEYMREKGMETKGIGVIQSNPEQSKHLETATMRVRDVWLDLVNLRSENYSEDSRIQEMEFGTAKDDAFRRDLTINALFYNINANEVEDFTERGIPDLERGLSAHTPLPPRRRRSWTILCGYCERFVSPHDSVSTWTKRSARARTIRTCKKRSSTR